MSAMEEIAVLDMEWTAWEGSWERGWTGPGEFREVVQIGAVKLKDTPELTEVAHWQVLVRPVINPQLSAYFTDLTGITQAAVEAEGIPLADAVGLFADFLAPAPTDVYSHGRDGQYLRENCDKIDVPFALDGVSFHNFVPDLSRFLEIPEGSLMSSRLPEIMGFPPPGDAHNAVADCRCIAEAMRIMRRAGAF